MEEGRYKPGDRVFAKMKGYSVWPARVAERLPGKVEQYKLHFYGTYNEGKIKLDMIYPYTPETIAKYHKSQKNAKLNEAMEQIANNIEITAAGPSPTKATHEDGEEGELQIDEGELSGPPVLVREVDPPLPSPHLGETPDSSKKITPAKTTQRRASKGKKESLKANSTTTTPNQGTAIVTAPTEPSATPQPEIVSRSGRKIKPKRFADEFESVEAPPKKARASSSSETPGAKRGKRGSVSKQGSADVTPVAEPPPPPGDPQVLPAPVPATPEPKKAKGKPPPLVKMIGKKGGGGRKSKSEGKKGGVAPGGVPKLENEGGVKPVAPQVPPKQKEPEGIKKISIFDNHGEEIEMQFDADRPKTFPNKQEEADWDTNTTKNIYKLKDELESQTQEASEMLTEILESEKPDERQDKGAYDEEMESRLKERRNNNIKQLRTEGEMIEIIGEIVESLSISGADVDRTLELLERLAGHNMTVLMLKKHPEVVETIVKLRNYVGDPVSWEFSPEAIADFAVKSKEIRGRASEIFVKMARLFDSQPDQEFVNHYFSEVDKFKEEVRHLSMKEVMALATDENGKPMQVEPGLLVSDDSEEEEELSEDLEGFESLEGPPESLEGPPESLEGTSEGLPEESPVEKEVQEEGEEPMEIGEPLQPPKNEPQSLEGVEKGREVEKSGLEGAQELGGGEESLDNGIGEGEEMAKGVEEELEGQEKPHIDPAVTQRNEEDTQVISNQ